MLGGAKVSSAQRKHKSHERWTLIHVAFDPAVQEVHVSDPGLTDPTCAARGMGSSESEVGWAVWIRSLWPTVWRPGVWPLVSCHVTVVC